MTTKRLFMGVIVMTEHRPGVTHNLIEKFVGWADDEDQARGAWVKQALEMHPAAAVHSVTPHDITEIALAVPA